MNVEKYFLLNQALCKSLRGRISVFFYSEHFYFTTAFIFSPTNPSDKRMVSVGHIRS